MKMTKEHYEALKGRVASLVLHQIPPYRQKLALNPKVRDADLRLLWDAFHATRMFDVYSNQQFDYKDDHIETAMKAIFKDLAVDRLCKIAQTTKTEFIKCSEDSLGLLHSLGAQTSAYDALRGGVQALLTADVAQQLQSFPGDFEVLEDGWVAGELGFLLTDSSADEAGFLRWESHKLGVAIVTPAAGQAAAPWLYSIESLGASETQGCGCVCNSWGELLKALDELNRKLPENAKAAHAQNLAGEVGAALAQLDWVPRPFSNLAQVGYHTAPCTSADGERAVGLCFAKNPTPILTMPVSVDKDFIVKAFAATIRARMGLRGPWNAPETLPPDDDVFELSSGAFARFHAGAWRTPSDDFQEACEQEAVAEGMLGDWRHLYAPLAHFDLKSGDRILCNGFSGTVRARYDESMVEVRVPGGEVCVSASYPNCNPGPRPLAPELRFGRQEGVFWAQDKADKADEIPAFAADLSGAQDRFTDATASRLVCFLAETSFRPEPMRVSEHRFLSGDVCFDVETFSRDFDRWVSQKSHETEVAAVLDAQGWYSVPRQQADTNPTPEM